MKLDSPFLVATLCLASTAFAQAPPDVVSAIRAEGLVNSRVMEHLDRLTNGIGHRLTGSDNFTLACRWAKQEFEAMGFEDVQLERWDTWPIVWNRGQWSGRVLTPEPLELQIATPAWTNGTRGRVEGQVLPLPKDEAALDEMAEQLPGAWLFGTMPSRRNPFLQVLQARCTAAGIAGFLQPSTGDEAYPNRMRVFGERPRSPEIPDGPPQIVIRKDQAERLAAMLDSGAEVVAEFDVRNRWRREPIDLHNVIAEIRGSEKPDEIVVVCGHLDSWHQATGTTDNGTGTASTMEAARILLAVGAKPKRTIRFCLWGGEEQGLLGSNAHVTMRRSEMDRISAVFNHDTGTNWAHSLRVTQAMLPLMQAVLEPVMALAPPDAGHEGPVFELQASEQLRGSGGSDHASFLRAGVPAFAWGLTGRSDYFRHTWHSQWDTYDVAIPAYMRHTSTVVALAALGVANLDEMLPREGVMRATGTDLKPMVEGFLGLSLGGENDLVVHDVVADGISRSAGFEKGDRIVAVRGQKVEKLLDLVQGLRQRGDAPRAITVDRSGELVELRLPPRSADGEGRGRRG